MSMMFDFLCMTSFLKFSYALLMFMESYQVVKGANAKQVQRYFFYYLKFFLGVSCVLFMFELDFWYKLNSGIQVSYSFRFLQLLKLCIFNLSCLIVFFQLWSLTRSDWMKCMDQSTNQTSIFFIDLRCHVPLYILKLFFPIFIPL